MKKITGNDTPEVNINREVRLVRARAIRVVMEDDIFFFKKQKQNKNKITLTNYKTKYIYF